MNSKDLATLSQNIKFGGVDKQDTIEICGQNVLVNSSTGTHSHGSSKVKFKNVVDYNWEMRFYSGQLLSVHILGNIVAYAVKGKTADLVRVRNVQAQEKETALIKGMKGTVQDLSFALIPEHIILACVDEECNLFVHKIHEEDNTITCNLLLHGVHPNASGSPSNYRIIWCNYIPSYNENADTIDDPSKLLAVLNGEKVQIWDLSILQNRGADGPIEPNNGLEGCMEINEHELDVVEASFSPDGTALATASLDGSVKFFQICNLEEGQLFRFLHKWVPHDGKPLSCLLFLDNIINYSPGMARFWKFVMTGSNYSSELKIWSCENWQCLQTITFLPNPVTALQLFFKPRLDLTAQYLLLSDISNRILYVLQIEKNEGEKVATVSHISEFPLPAPILSYAITCADICKVQFTNGSSENLFVNEQDSPGPGGEMGFGDVGVAPAHVIKMYAVQPKSLQLCTITYRSQDMVPIKQVGDWSAANKEVTLDNGVSDLATSVNFLLQQQPQNQSSQPALNLMTPDDFTSPPSNSSSPNNKSTTPSSVKPALEDAQVKIENAIDGELPEKDNFASAGSSPSREVEEILSCKSHEYFDNLHKIDDESPVESQNNFNNENGDLVFVDASGNKEVVWPNIPIVNADEIDKEESRRQELQLSGAAEIDLDRLSDIQQRDKSQLHQLSLRMTALENLIHDQNCQIQKLTQEVQATTKPHQISDDIQALFAKELDLAMSRQQLQQSKLFENCLNLKRTIDHDQNEEAMANMSQLVSKQLQHTVAHEIKHLVLPSVMNTFETLKHQLSADYAQKLKSTEHALKDSITKLVGSRVIVDSLTTSVVNVIKPSLEQCYKEMITSTLVPSWEKVCSTMFQQIHDTFTKGTKEYTASVESYMDRQRRVQDKGRDLITQMLSVSDTMKNNSDKLTASLTQEIQQQMTTSLNKMHDRLSMTLAEMVNDQINKALKNHASILEDRVINAVRSRSVTPAPHVIDTQMQLAQIQQHLLSNRIESAFQQALSASDLSLVVYVCEKVNPYDVFKKDNTGLSQPVILSLIQQLGADLSKNTELKQEYLQEALLNLETAHVDTRKHVPLVLKELLRQLNVFLANNTMHKSYSRIRMLRMAAHALLSEQAT